MRILVLSVAAVLTCAIAAPAWAHNAPVSGSWPGVVAQPGTEGDGQAMEPVTNLQYELFPGITGQNGTDIEFFKAGATEYAVAGTGRNGMQIVDITDPTAPTVAGVYDCPINQGDVQIFRQGERILATYTADSAIAPTDRQGNRDKLRLASQCVTETIASGMELTGDELGTFIVDITDPSKPKTVSFIGVPEGSHNQTIHPSGDYLYNSNSDLIGAGGLPEVTIHDISNPAVPKKIQDYRFEPIPTSVGTESHDIFFNATGTRAYVAALSHTLILDTSNPEAPVEVSKIIDPAIQVVHQSDLVTLPRKDGTTRDILIITDEQGGAAATAGCPGGGLHIYDVTGDLENEPVKLGTWFIDRMTSESVCTSHVLRMYPDQALMTIAWYRAGVRVLDISGLAELEGGREEVAFGEGAGLKEIGNYVFTDTNTWSFKTNRIETDGSFYGYGNDIRRGFDVYRFDGELNVPALEPEDLAAPGCSGVPVATAYVDRDEARDVHERSIDCVIWRSIARGAVRDARWFYEPLKNVTRGQMASFIVNALRVSGIDKEFPAAPAEPKFDDLGDSPHANNINLLAEAGIVSGTGEGKYSPEAPITRAQMATFLVKAANFAVDPDLAESGGQRFSDVGGNTHADNIEVGSDNALFSGTSTSRFSPGATVQRDQMASFLTNLHVRITDSIGASANPA
jgi:hypothetical protein